MKKTASLLTLVALFVSTFTAHAETGVPVWKIDTVHSGVTFNVRHFFTRVPGSFGGFSGEIHFDPAHIDKAKAVATIAIPTVNTNNADRDKHLQNDDFFSSPQFPEATFVSSKWEASGENKFKVHGDLTIRGITKPVVLDVDFLGVGEGRNGVVISGWDATAKIDRRDFGITYGQGVVGNDVEITLNIQAHRQ